MLNWWICLIICIPSEKVTVAAHVYFCNADKLYHQYLNAALQMMCDHYQDHIITEFDQKTVVKVLQILAETKDGAVIYHCTEG